MAFPVPCQWARSYGIGQCSQGTWKDEDAEQLKSLVAQKGRKWKEIGSILNRLPEGCRDKFKEISLGSAKNKGRWSLEETKKLHDAVHDYIAKRVVRSLFGMLAFPYATVAHDMNASNMQRQPQVFNLKHLMFALAQRNCK